MAKTRKLRVVKEKKAKITIPQLRKAFDHMDRVVESLRKDAHHSFSDVVVKYREEWRKTFKHELAPADAAAYLKFRYGMKEGKTRRAKTRGGTLKGGAIAGSSGAPLDYQTRAGESGVYGNFPTYQTQGLDRSYSSAITADCGKPNGFPTDGSAASQRGGMFEGSRPIIASPPGSPLHTAYEMSLTNPGMGTVPYPASNPDGYAPTVPIPHSSLPSASFATSIRSIGNVSHTVR